jgi:hypothetical protein
LAVAVNKKSRDNKVKKKTSMHRIAIGHSVPVQDMEEKNGSDVLELAFSEVALDLRGWELNSA